MTLQPGDRAHLVGRIGEVFIPPDDHYRVFLADGDDEPLITEDDIEWAAVQPLPVDDEPDPRDEALTEWHAAAGS